MPVIASPSICHSPVLQIPADLLQVKSHFLQSTQSLHSCTCLLVGLLKVLLKTLHMLLQGVQLRTGGMVGGYCVGKRY